MKSFESHWAELEHILGIKLRSNKDTPSQIDIGSKTFEHKELLAVIIFI